MSGPSDVRPHEGVCGCCAGITAETPIAIDNPPGLSALAYRVGTHSRFLHTMLGRLSAADGSLKELRTRAQDDFSIAFFDSCAAVLDVLAFQQERIANECYARTAIERESIVELTRLIGYQLRPGVAASAYLTFTLEEAPGAPEQETKQTTIDAGTKVQSIPTPGENPQVYETVEKTEARIEWNAMRPRRTRRHSIDPKTTDPLFFEGLATGLRPGDGLLITKDDGTGGMLRQVARVTVEPRSDRTKVDLQPAPPTFEQAPGPTSAISKALAPAAAPITTNYMHGAPVAALDFHADAVTIGFDPKHIFANVERVRPTPPGVLAFRTRAAIFGHNAQTWRSLPISQRVGELPPGSIDPADLKPGEYSDREGSWADGTTLRNYPRADGEDPANIYLDNLYPAVVNESWVALRNGEISAPYSVTRSMEVSKADFALSGKVTRLRLDRSIGFEKFTIRGTTVFAQSEQLPLARLPIDTAVEGLQIELDRLVDGLYPGQRLIVCGELDVMRGVRACELAVIVSVSYLIDKEDKEGRTQITLERPIAAYVRDTVTIHGNVARATHGETVHEVLGSGDASRPNQQFELRQTPLTYVKAATPSGAESTLQVRVNDVLWRETPSLYGHGPEDRVYTTRIANSGATIVEGGDGVTGGARFPSGQQNIRATHRKGIGLDGVVKSGQLSLLLTRPLGVKGVTNPLDTEGAADPEPTAEARRNAPLTVLTLDRIVSLKDHEDFARAFAGIAKALASSTWDGQTRSVFITVAGADGAPVPAGSDTSNHLLAAMARAGDPFVMRRVLSYKKALFRISARVKLAADVQIERTLKAIEEALRARFGFDARAFGQPATVSEAIALVHSISGVLAVDVDKFYRTDHPAVPLAARLDAALPRSGADGQMLAAELLTLDAAALELGVMP